MRFTQKMNRLVGYFAPPLCRSCGHGAHLCTATAQLDAPPADNDSIAVASSLPCIADVETIPTRAAGAQKLRPEVLTWNKSFAISKVECEKT
jgi:hypothetical protein